METLKGIFSMPKMDRSRRNFLRENKLSLRELQRVTNKNRMQQQQEQVMREQKYAGRRAFSQQRNNNNGLEKQTVSRCPSLTRVPSGRAVGGTSIAGFVGMGDGASHVSRRSVSRTNSTTTVKSVHKQVQTEDIQDEQFLYEALKRCSNNDTQSRFNGLQPNYTPRSHSSAFDAQSRTSYYPAPPPPPQQPPPDDDEEQPRGFENTDGNLYTARQIHDAYDQQQHDRRSEHMLQQLFKKEQQQQQGKQKTPEDYETGHAPNSSSKYNLASTPRSQQHYANGYNMVDSDGLPEQTTMQASYEPADQKLQHQHQHEQLQQQTVHYRMQPHVEQDGVRSNFENMSQNNGGGAGGDCNIGGDAVYGGYDGIDAISGGVDAVSISGRSRRTNLSQQGNTDLMKKRSTGSIHKLGSRDNLSLPRYLEREKREKEEERQRQSERDPNCPPGHYTLSDEERQAALQSAESRFKALINELNHMPMTTETLRMRLRKAEIEKELKLLETDIRVFSKSKVYVKRKEDL